MILMTVLADFAHTHCDFQQTNDYLSDPEELWPDLQLRAGTSSPSTSIDPILGDLVLPFTLSVLLHG